MQKFTIIALDECGHETGGLVYAKDRGEAWLEAQDMYPEWQIQGIMSEQEVVEEQQRREAWARDLYDDDSDDGFSRRGAW